MDERIADIQPLLPGKDLFIQLNQIPGSFLSFPAVRGLPAVKLNDFGKEKLLIKRPQIFILQRTF